MWGATIQHRFRIVAALGVGLLAMVVGCQTEEITSYRVKRPERDRMLAAIAPNGENTWFFKMDGTEHELEEHADEFDELLKSLKFANGEIQWQLPKGWSKEEGKGLRYATLNVTPTVSVSVTRFPSSPVLANVNRWRKQMSLPEIAEEDLPKQVKTLTVDGVQVTLVDLVGERNPVAQMPPFAANEAKIPQPPPPVEEELTYDTPKEWTKVPVKFNFQKAAFAVADGDQQARITISVATGSFLDNVNRWRKMIDLATVNEAGLRDILGSVKVGDLQADYVDLIGPKKEGPSRIVAAILTHADQNYFFKMDGPNDLVGRQKPIFETFLSSVRFKKGAGE